MVVSYDSLALGQKFQLHHGSTIYRKVANLVSENAKTGHLMFDARAYRDESNEPAFPMAECPDVIWPVEKGEV